MTVLKRKDFARWQAGEKLPDTALCKAVHEMEDDKANITQDERKALQFAGRVFLELSEEDLTKALKVGVLLEVCCDEQAH